jgi:WD domain, G-beta repeat.
MTYENNIDIDKITDPNLLSTITTQIFHFGRTPTQLFTKPHPQKKSLNKIIEEPNIFFNTTGLKIYNSGLSKLKSVQNLFSQRAIVRMRIVRDRELYCIRFNRTISKFMFNRSINEHRNYFSCDPVQSIDHHKEGFIDSEDNSLRVYNPPYQFFQSCKSVAFGGFWDGRIKLHKYTNSEPLYLKFAHSSTVTCLEISEDERTAITGSRDGECIV